MVVQIGALALLSRRRGDRLTRCDRAGALFVARRASGDALGVVHLLDARQTGEKDHIIDRERAHVGDS